MKRVEIQELFANPEQYKDQVIRVNGWAKQIRDQKNFCFIQLSDGTYFTPVQVIVSADKVQNYEEVSSQGVSTAFEVIGEFILTPEMKQPFEIQAQSVEVLGECSSEYPLQPKRHSPEYLRTIAHLRPRSNLFTAVFKVRSEASFAIHKFFHDRGFMYVHTPIITASDAEGAGEMFRVTTLNPAEPPRTDTGAVDYSEDFFGKSTFLSVSGQLNVETFAQAYSKVYTFGPTFRAENSNTARHAAEFWMIEPEISFADLGDIMDLSEAMLKFIIEHILTNCEAEMAFFNQFVDKGLLDRLNQLKNSEFRRMTYTEAMEILESSGKTFKFPLGWGEELQTEHERYLTEEVVKGPVFVTDYPKTFKAFYMRLNDDGKTVAAMDCLVPGIGEIIGGSQREERLDQIIQLMEEKGIKPEEYDWYLDLRKYGSTKHAGYGLGFERLIMYLTGVSNIRDVLPFPRTTGHAAF